MMCLCVNTIYVYRIQLADGAWELTNAGRAVFGNNIKRLMQGSDFLGRPQKVSYRRL